MRKLFLVLLSAFSATHSAGENNNPVKSPGAVGYYTSITSKHFPFHPANEIVDTDIDLQHSYVKAEYDEKGRLIVMKKYIKGTIFFVQKFEYSDKGDPVLAVLYDSESKELQRREY